MGKIYKHRNNQSGERNKISAIPKHSWNPTGNRNEFKCWKCGIVMRTDGSKGFRTYYIDNKEIKNPGCNDVKPIIIKSQSLRGFRRSSKLMRILIRIKTIVEADISLEDDYSGTISFSGIKRMIYGIWHDGKNEQNHDMVIHFNNETSKQLYKDLMLKFCTTPEITVNIFKDAK